MSSTTRSKATKSKSNSNKKLRKSIRETDDIKPSNRSDIGVQVLKDKKTPSEQPATNSGRETSICKSLENLMQLKKTSHDTISMSKTDISIVYGMYKTLVQKHNFNKEIYAENYQNLLNEFYKIQSRLNEQDLCYKSLLNIVTSLMSRNRKDRRMRRKTINEGNKIMIMKLNQIASVISKLQLSLESLETSKLEENVAAENPKALQNKKKNCIFCRCM